MSGRSCMFQKRPVLQTDSSTEHTYRPDRSPTHAHQTSVARKTSTTSSSSNSALPKELPRLVSELHLVLAIPSPLEPRNCLQPYLFSSRCTDLSSALAHMLCVQRQPYHGPVPFSRSPSATVDISLLLKPKDEEENHSGPASAAVSSNSASAPRSVVSTPGLAPHPPPTSSVPAKRLSSGQTHPSESPAKKQSKWSPDEDAKIIELRGNGMKWEDISKQLPGRSAISCRLHYQNYLERRSEWDEDRKNKLARLYERFKADMWAKIAEEMTLPWRAAEAMHWQMGEHEMARRAGVTAFSLSNNQPMPPSSMPPRLHMRHSSAATRMRGDSLPRNGPPQLPSLAELTAGLPAYATQPGTPYHDLRSPPQIPTQMYNYHQAPRH